jgi:hypothetical protein
MALNSDFPIVFWDAKTVFFRIMKIKKARIPVRIATIPCVIKRKKNKIRTKIVSVAMIAKLIGHTIKIESIPVFKANIKSSFVNFLRYFSERWPIVSNISAAVLLAHFSRLLKLNLRRIVAKTLLKIIKAIDASPKLAIGMFPNQSNGNILEKIDAPDLLSPDIEDERILETKRPKRAIDKRSIRFKIICIAINK